MTSIVPKFKQPGQLLNHILDQPDLPAIIQHLDVKILTKLIRHIGLEDSAQIISFATADQLKGVLDEDLWRSETPGKDETFDARRFGLWLEIMMENGIAFAAQKVMELDEDLLILGLCRLVLVMDRHNPVLRSGDGRNPANGIIMDKVLDSSLNQEFGNYLMISKNDSNWDAVCALLTELNESNYEMLTRVLHRCCWVTREYIEDNGGLLNVLTGDEMLEEDVSSERNDRRESKGFVTPTSAALFLNQSRSTDANEIIAQKTIDPISRIYFKTIESKAEHVSESQPTDNAPGKEDSEVTHLKITQFLQTLQNAEVLPASDQKMLNYTGNEPWNHFLPLAKAMRFINQSDPDLYDQLLKELSYLSNILISGCGFQERTFQPKEAAEGAFSVCNLGIEYLSGTHLKQNENELTDSLTTLLETHHLIKMFQAGWKILFDAVVFRTANAVLEFIIYLKDETIDPDQEYEIAHMVKLLRSHISFSRPWEFVEEMDYLQIFLDGEVITAITGLLREYPTLSKPIYEREGLQASSFISSQSHIRAIRNFLNEKL